MFTFFFLIILLFILWPLIRVAWRVWSNMRTFRRFMADPEAEMRRQAARNAGGRYDAQAQQPRRKDKKIPRDVGEYVSFTEIEVTEEEKRASDGTTSSFRREEQITDIKWTDL